MKDRDGQVRTVEIPGLIWPGSLRRVELRVGGDPRPLVCLPLAVQVLPTRNLIAEMDELATFRAEMRGARAEMRALLRGLRAVSEPDPADDAANEPASPP